MNGETVVDRLHADFQEIVGKLDPTDISLRNVAEENFRKILLLAAASLFEREVREQVLHMVHARARGSDLAVELVRRKAVERQYHTYFNWEGRNANSFFAMFGEGFKGHMTNRVKEEDWYDGSIRAFLEIGNERNRLVHQDFGTYTLEKLVQKSMKRTK